MSQMIWWSEEIPKHCGPSSPTPRGRRGPWEKETALLSAHRFIPIPDEYLADELHCRACGFRCPRDQAGPAAVPTRKCPQCDIGMYDWYNDGGYAWCIKNWGTKWGLYDVEATEAGFEDGHIGYTFRTAWSPPIPVIQAMSKQFPSLSFALDYFEGGMGFMGSCECENGQEVGAGSAPYHGDRGG